MNYAQTVGRKVVIAAGMADFDPEKDASLADVVSRADAKMYENKKSLKQELGI